jgi:hypothetical protein
LKNLQKEGEWWNQKPTHPQAIVWPDMSTCDPETGVKFLNYFLANRDEKTGRVSQKAMNFEEGLMPADFPPEQHSFSPSYIASTLTKGRNDDEFIVDTGKTSKKARKPAAAAKPAEMPKKKNMTYRPNFFYGRIGGRKPKKIVYNKKNLKAKELAEEQKLIAKELAEEQKLINAAKQKTVESDGLMAMGLHMDYLDSVHVKIKMNVSSTVVPPVATTTTIKIEKLAPTATTIATIKVEKSEQEK